MAWSRGLASCRSGSPKHLVLRLAQEGAVEDVPHQPAGIQAFGCTMSGPCTLGGIVPDCLPVWVVEERYRRQPHDAPVTRGLVLRGPAEWVAR